MKICERKSMKKNASKHAREVTLESQLINMASTKESPPSKKRDRKGNEDNGELYRNKTVPSVATDSSMIALFQAFQLEIDSRHDKHERIVKLSRDITIESKRTIFLLHRDASGNNEAILEQTYSKLKELIGKKFHPLAEELQGEDPYQFLRAYTNGIQEFVEAISFYFYIKDNRLVSLQEIQQMLDFHIKDDEEIDQELPKTFQEFDPNRLCVFVRPVDFLLGN